MLAEKFKMSITEKLRLLLQEKHIEYKEIDHEAAQTCEISAKARGEDIKIGGKTLLFKDKKGFHLFVLSAEKQVDSNKVRQILKSQKLRFATEQELQDLCYVQKGALPPFGKPIYPYDLYLDESILYNEKIAFNAGILTKSFILNTQDYLTLVCANYSCFAK
ncbi:YbaK/EbsC family protein [Pseudoalteromonas denitrificans]|nr:YbaK/EbsC family protein [Pseudoalteromonas denitrificans]